MKSIGNGEPTRIWFDKWTLDGESRRPYNKQIFMDLVMKVAQLIAPQGH